MHECPSCKGLSEVNDRTCFVCLGWGVVVSVVGPCHRCHGKGCVTCSNKGIVIDPIPFVDFEPVVIDMKRIRTALSELQAGLGINDDDGNDTQAYTMASTLMWLGIEHEAEHGFGPGEWINQILVGDGIIIDPSGIWVQVDQSGVRVHQFA